MNDSLNSRAQKIMAECLAVKSTDPVEIFEQIACKEYVRIHGPEHHILDGAALLTAFYHAGGAIDLESALAEMVQRGLTMPGATCGLWGVCGAASSLGAALSIIDRTGPLTTDESWGKHMAFTSSALAALARIGGPRCCKRDAYLSLQQAVRYVNETYPVTLPVREIACGFSGRNEQCLGDRCPFYHSPDKAKKKVAFICVHNSCRSQIAEALGRHLAGDVFESYSAGTETKPHINPDAVRWMKELYGIDMEETQYSKLISDIPAPDVAIAMGCNVGCPFVGRPFDADWGLDDPTGQGDEAFKQTIAAIEQKVLQLKKELSEA